MVFEPSSFLLLRYRGAVGLCGGVVFVWPRRFERGAAALGLRWHQQYGVGDRSLSHGVETAIVGWVVDDAVGAAAGDVHGGGASAVEIGGIAAAQPSHDVGELGQREAVGVLFATSVGNKQDDGAVGLEAYGSTVVAGVDEAAVEPLGHRGTATDEHRAGGHHVAVGHIAFAEAVAVGYVEAGPSAGQQPYGGVLVVFAVDAVVAPRFVVAQFFATDAQVMPNGL